MGLNRSRILAAARADGTVQVRVTTRLRRCVELEGRWGLQRAIVVPRPEGRVAVEALIGGELGAYLNGVLRPRMTLGLGWGKTLSSGLPSIELRGPEGLSVVSVLGGLTLVSAVNPSEFAWRVADRLSAECLLLAAPVFALDVRTREALLAHAGIREVFERAGSLDVAVVSSSDLGPHSTLGEYGLLTRDELA